MNHLALATLLTLAATPALAQPAPPSDPTEQQIEQLHGTIGEYQAMLGSVTHDKLAADVQLAQARQQMQAMGKQMRAMQAELTQAQAAAKAIAPPPTVPAAE